MYFILYLFIVCFNPFGDWGYEYREGRVGVPFPGLTLQMFVFPNRWFDLTGRPYLLQFYPGLTWPVITPNYFTFILVWPDWWSHLLTSFLPWFDLTSDITPTNFILSWFDLTGDHSYQLHFYPGLTWLVITPTNFIFILVWPDWWSLLSTSFLSWYDLTGDHSYQLHF